MGLAHRPAGRLANGAAFPAGQALAETAVLAQAYARRHGIGQRDTAAGRRGLLGGTLGAAAPAVITLVRSSLRAQWCVLERGEHQQSDTAEPEQMDTCDPEHEGSPAHGARLAQS